MQKEKKVLLELLERALQKENKKDRVPEESELSEAQWQKLIAMAEKHAVLSLLYEPLKECRALEGTLWKKTKQISRQTVRTSYRLLFLNKYITELLAEHEISVIALKGVSTASLYPVPELRKSGDVDLLVPDAGKHVKACRILQENGFRIKEEQKTLHHIELENDEKISVELHGMLAEPFESQKVNGYLSQLLPDYEKNVRINRCWGIDFLEPTDAYHAFYLILHMLQHFLRAGFGLKNLCDWVVFWNRDVAQKEKEQFRTMAAESGTIGFIRILTAACVKYLGLERNRVAFLLDKEVRNDVIEEFIEEIFEAEEFGKSKGNRMVAMRDTGMLAYMREFHHQMRLNYPRAAKAGITWPFLWLATLCRFLYNNHTIRNISSAEILRKAGKRSRLIKHMKLF